MTYEVLIDGYLAGNFEAVDSEHTRCGAIRSKGRRKPQRLVV